MRSIAFIIWCLLSIYLYIRWVFIILRNRYHKSSHTETFSYGNFILYSLRPREIVLHLQFHTLQKGLHCFFAWMTLAGGSRGVLPPQNKMLVAFVQRSWSAVCVVSRMSYRSRSTDRKNFYIAINVSSVSLQYLNIRDPHTHVTRR